MGASAGTVGRWRGSRELSTTSESSSWPPAARSSSTARGADAAQEHGRRPTWEDLKPPARSGNIIGFSGFYTVTRDAVRHVGRHEPGADALDRRRVSWSPLDVGLDLSRDYYTPDIVSAGFDLYLLAAVCRRPERTPALHRQWRYVATGAAPDAEGVQRIAVAPDGTLWAGRSAGLRALDPAQVKWGAVARFHRAVRNTHACTDSHTRTEQQPDTVHWDRMHARSLRQTLRQRKRSRSWAARSPRRRRLIWRQRFEQGQMLWRLGRLHLRAGRRWDMAEVC